jgi:hypothetical protein
VCSYYDSRKEEREEGRENIVAKEEKIQQKFHLYYLYK